MESGSPTEDGKPLLNAQIEASRQARRARDVLAVEWVVIPLVVAVVIAIGFGLRFALG